MSKQHHSLSALSSAFEEGILKVKVVEIGGWDMDADASKNVAHGLTLSKIRAVSVVVRNDAGDTYYAFSTASPTNPHDIVIQYIDATNVVLQRANSTAFDSTGYDQTPYNRGWITIWYEP